jgi:hypothetical protein
MTVDRDDHQPTADQRPAPTALTWRRAPRALWRRSSDRTVVLSPGRDEPLVLSGAGQAIWEVLDEPIEEHDLVAVLVDTTQADPDQVANDVGTFLARLAEEGAVIRDGDEP